MVRRRNVEAFAWIVRAALAGSLGPAVIACGSDAGDGCVASACDITDAQCQKAIFAATACEREQSGAAMPKVRTISPAEYMNELTAAQTAPTANAQTWSTVLELLGFLPAGQTLGEASTATSATDVAAYYSTETKSVTVIDRGGSDQLQDLFTLSHEFVHSLQDAETGIEGFDRKWAHSTDSDAAVLALIEGEAVVLSGSVLSRSVGRDPDWPSLETSVFDAIFGSIDDGVAPFLTAMESLPYPVGLKGLRPPWVDSGQRGIHAFYVHPRQSLVDWVHDVKLGSTIVEPLDCFPTAPPPGYAAVDHDTFGIVGAMIVFMRSGIDARGAYEASRVWRNDSIVTFAPSDPADTGRAVAWRTHWDAPANATKFQAVAKRALPTADVVQDQSEVTLRVASTSQVLTQWDDTACGAESDLPTAPPSTTDTMTSALRHARWR